MTSKPTLACCAGALGFALGWLIARKCATTGRHRRHARPHRRLRESAADYKAVYDRWLDQVNKKGGLLGRQVKMVIYNDESTPTVAQQLYNRMLDQDKVDLVLAPFSTFVGGAVVPIVTSHKKLLFNGGFVGINIFKRCQGLDHRQLHLSGARLHARTFRSDQIPAEDKRPKRAAIFTAQNPFPRSGARREWAARAAR